jgi:hypothetical protein
MGLQFNQIDDAVLLTQNRLIKRGAFIDMQTDLTDHVAVREMWKARQKQFDGGKAWEFDVQMDHNHSARTVGLYESDGSSLHDTMKKGEVDIRHVNAHYLYDLHEKAFQRGGHAIVDLIKTRYVAMMVSLFELMEGIMWGKPTDSSDTKTPFGIAYWVVKSAQEGFYGGNPAGFSDGAAGISTTEFPRWANYTAQYSRITKEDLIRKLRRAHRRTQFRSPVSHAEPVIGGMSNGIYTNDAVIGLLEEVLEANNMSLGNDLASKDGKVTFKSTPVQYAPKLDGDSSDPIYMLDWKWIGVGVLPGWENNLSAPYMVPGKHNVRRVDLDASMNTVCTDRRRQAVISK